MTASSLTARCALQRLSAGVLATALLSLAAPLAAQAAPVTIRHQQGELTLPAVPKRVVAYDVGVLDILHRLGVPVAGVPGGNLPAFLGNDGRSDLPRVGTLFQPDYGALSQIRPDLVIVAGRSQAKYAVLSRLLPTVDLSAQGDPIAATLSNIRTLGALFNRQQAAERLVADLQQRLAAVRAQAATQGKGLLILAVGDKLQPMAPGSRFGILHAHYGVPAVLPPASGARGEPLTLDRIAQIDPDWLYVIDRNAATGTREETARKLFDHPTIAATRAARKGRIVFLDPYDWYILGAASPTAIERTAAQLQALYAR